MGYDAGLKVGIDGEADFKNGLKSLNSEIKTIGSELRAVTKEFENNAASMEALTTKNKVLAKEVDLHKAKVELLSKEYKTQTDELKKLEQKLEDAKKAHSEDSEEVKKAQKEYETQAGKVRKLESDLGTATSTLNRYTKEMDINNQSIKDQISDTAKFEKELTDLKTEMGTLESDQKKLTSTFKLQRAELGLNVTEAEKLELAQQQLKAQMELTDKVVGNLDTQLDKAKKAYGENSNEVKDLETKLNDAKTKVIEFKEKLEDVKEGADTAGDGLEDLNKNVQSITLFEMADALQGVTDKIIDLGKSAFDTAMAFGDSQTDIQANLGLTGSEAEALNDVVKNVFENGVVGSVEEATNAVIIAKQSFGELNDVELESLVNQLTTIAERTGTDVNDNIIAVDKLMSAFGITSTEALDLVAAGFQNGLNKNGDFLDTLNEYPFYFEQAGFSAEEMMQIIDNGMENGAMNTDKAADAVKEFQIRLGDGSIEGIIGSFSAETQDMFQKWENGEATVADVAKSIGLDLQKMSPTEQQAAVSLLSSQFEDLGVDGATALFKVGDAFSDTTGKAKEMAEQSPGEKWEASIRKLQDALLPIGNTLKDAFTPIIDAVAQVAEQFTTLPAPVQTAISGIVIAIGGIISAIPIVAMFAASFNTLAPLFAGITGSAGGLGGALAALTGPIGIAIAAVAAIGAVIAGAWQNSETFRTSVGTAFESIKTTISEAFVKISEAMAPALEAFQGFAVNMQPVLQQIGDFLGIYIVPLVQQFIESFINGFANIIVAIAPFIEGIANLFNFIGNFVGAVFALFTGDWDSAWKFAQGMAQAAVDFLGNIVEGLKNLFILIFGDIIIDIQAKWMTFQVYTTAIWNDVVTFLQTTCQAIYDNTIGKIIELVTTLANKWEETKTDTQAKWEAIKIDLATKWEAIKTNIATKVQEVFTNLANKWQETKEDTQTKWEAIKSDLATKWEAIYKNVSEKVQETFKEVSAKWESTKTDSNTKWAAIVSDLTTKVGEIFTNVTTKIQDIVTELPKKWDAIKDAAADAWGKEPDGVVPKILGLVGALPGKLFGLAKDMLDELVKGIKDNTSVTNLTDAVGGLVKTVLEKFKNGFGIASPSKELFNIGKFLMQGLINGLNGDNLMAFVNNMVEEIKAAFAAGNFNLKAAIDFVGSGAMEFFKSIGIGGATFSGLTAPVGGGVTSDFGWRTHPITGDQRFHEGIDIGAGYGTPVGAAGAGEVTKAGWYGGYGNTVILDHGNGLSTLYAHLSEIMVSVGQLVSQLQTIGLVGSTGNSTGPHLHFGVYQDGVPIDPSSLFGFNVGSRYIPQDMVAMIHEGEMIVPKSENPYANSGGQIMPGTKIEQNIYITSPKELSPSETAKINKRTWQELALSL
ncbi:MAG: phage tail tape measure protein [Firmicutes bacterium HGW-Firmicutes-17]|nr:MAG: phage tail tape measure protein [Firmicutes bacterium HGW-Firmicutes-17]